MNWYIKAISQYADFSGRAGRKDFWMFTAFNIVLIYGLRLLANVAEVPALLFAATLYTLFILVPSFAIAVRRMHDVGKSGWFLLTPIYSIILACTDGEMVDNSYGANPNATPDTILQKV